MLRKGPRRADASLWVPPLRFLLRARECGADSADLAGSCGPGRGSGRGFGFGAGAQIPGGGPGRGLGLRHSVRTGKSGRVGQLRGGDNNTGRRSVAGTRVEVLSPGRKVGSGRSAPGRGHPCRVKVRGGN